MLIEFTILFVMVIVYLLYNLCKRTRPKNFPPGPTNLPIVGAGPYVGKLDPVLSTALSKLGDEYGPLCGAYFGKTLSVVVNGYEAVHEVMTREDFSGRPDLYIVSYLWDGLSLGIFFSNGPLWKEQRRFSLRHLRDFGFGKSSMEALVHEEVAECLTHFNKKLEKSKDNVVTIHDAFGASVINVLWVVMCGKRYSYDDEHFNNILVKLTETFRAGNPLGNFVNDFPFLRFLPVFSGIWNQLMTGQKEMLKILEEIIDEHEETRDKDYSRDFIDVYLKAIEEQKENGVENSTFFKKQLLSICSDLLAGGAETTGSSITFGLLYMILYPEVQEKLQKELDTVVGKDRLPSIADKPNLPYTEAVLTELLRVANIAPLSVPHSALQDAKLQGYDIPKGTMFSINLTSVHMDKKYWKDPENFRPERFLDSDGKFVKSDRVIAFGIGKRNCVGEPLARMNTFCFFTAMVQRFKFEVVPGQPKPSTIPLPGFTVAPQPFEAKVSCRY